MTTFGPRDSRGPATRSQLPTLGGLAAQIAQPVERGSVDVTVARTTSPRRPIGGSGEQTQNRWDCRKGASLLLSVGARPAQDLREGGHQDPQVERERPLVDVLEIHAHPLVAVDRAP